MEEASTTGFRAPGGWSWPDDIPKQRVPPHGPDSSASQQIPPQHTNTSAGTGSTGTSNSHSEPQQQNQQQYRRHYKPRTCRICLETVQPTFHAQTDNLPEMLQSRPYVTYESEDGRLICPCKCKGSSRYVHDTCLQEWRHADPGYGKRNFWECPTCGFRYRLERMRWGRWISSQATQITVTLAIFVLAIFLLGFVADPIINLYVDPVSTIVDTPRSKSDWEAYARENEDPASWPEHFLKGFASLGVLGFIKMFFSMSPFHWLNFRSGIWSTGGGRRGGATGRDRAANISWVVLIVGVGTFLYTVWKGVRAWSGRVLRKAGERVMDVHGDNPNDDDEDDNDG
ncbi:MAG: hypothetical protein M1831_006169 [Alyxoria varia]|nr:MAG: hypothetical protein M1831_006169 [Alyxoria varia]